MTRVSRALSSDEEYPPPSLSFLPLFFFLLPSPPPPPSLLRERRFLEEVEEERCGCGDGGSTWITVAPGGDMGPPRGLVFGRGGGGGEGSAESPAIPAAEDRGGERLPS